MVDTYLERFKNLLNVKNELCLEEIKATFNEYDLKALIYMLGTLQAIEREQNGKTDIL